MQKIVPSRLSLWLKTCGLPPETKSFYFITTTKAVTASYIKSAERKPMISWLSPAWLSCEPASTPPRLTGKDKTLPVLFDPALDCLSGCTQVCVLSVLAINSLCQEFTIFHSASSTLVNSPFSQKSERSRRTDCFLWRLRWEKQTRTGTLHFPQCVLLIPQMGFILYNTLS